MTYAISPNIVRDVTNAPDLWSADWRNILTRLHAGWRPKVFSDGLNAVVSGMTSVASLPANWLSSLTNVGGGGTGPSVGAKAFSGQMTITGVSGLVVPTSTSRGSEGNYITFTGFASGANNGTFQILEVLSTTSCVILNTSGVASDANNGGGGVTWQEKGFDGASYVPANWSGRAPWCVLGGPRTIKVPITSAISSSFRIGETLSQGSGSTERRGELLGYVLNAAGNAGWLVIDPHDYGTWDTSTVTGLLSAATMTPSATPLVYEIEYVFGKSSSNYSSGVSYWGCFEASGEAADSFSSRGASAAIGVPSGMASNTFPLHAIAQMGDGSLAGGAGSHRNYGSTTASDWGARAQVMCATCLPRTDSNGVGRAADGTSILMLHTGAAVSTDGAVIEGFFRLDGCERGDVCPYASLGTVAMTISGYERRTRSNNTTALTSSGVWVTSTSNYWQSFLARGNPNAARDIAQPYYMCMESIGATIAMMANNSEIMREANHPDASPPYVRMRPALWCDGTGTTSATDTQQPAAAMVKHRKGYPRWLMVAGTGARISTFDTLRWVTFSEATAALPAVALGPYDGTTTPVA
jgi:hypothetical protein